MVLTALDRDPGAAGLGGPIARGAVSRLKICKNNQQKINVDENIEMCSFLLCVCTIAGTGDRKVQLAHSCINSSNNNTDK